MPLKNSKDSEGCYYAWGNRKFHYECGNQNSRRAAKSRAIAFAFQVTPQEAKREFDK